MPTMMIPRMRMSRMMVPMILMPTMRILLILAWRASVSRCPRSQRFLRRSSGLSLSFELPNRVRYRYSHLGVCSIIGSFQDMRT